MIPTHVMQVHKCIRQKDQAVRRSMEQNVSAQAHVSLVGYVSNVLLDTEVEAKFVRNNNPSQQPLNNISYSM